MEQVFRIEIPVEAVDKTDTAAFQRLETTIQKLFAAMKNNKAAANDVFDAIESGAIDAKTAIKQTDSALDNMSGGLENSADAAGNAADALDDTASSAKTAGQRAGSAFDGAAQTADKFSQRMEKSNKTLRDMFNEKLSLTLSAIDRASPVLKSVWNSAKSLVGKTWNVAVRMKDFITAPFRKLWDMINSPITMALSVVGVGFSASDVLSTYNGFESQMSGVRALTGATNDDFLLLKETAKQLGAETSFSASEAAEGMQNLASAGFNTSEIVAAMPGMLDLAASSGEDLAVASDIAATTLRGFGLEASEAAHVADVLAEAAARTNANVADTGEAMKYIAPIANTMGLSLEEVAAAIGLLSDAGIKGSQAGTTLRGALSRLAKPTEDMQEVMKDLGLSFYDSNGQMKSISAIVGMLKTNMASLTDEQRQNALVTLFGQEALSGMMVLMEGGSEKIDALRESLESCEGAASEMAKVRLDNLAGDMEELSGAVETAKLDIMEKLDPYLRSAVQWLTTKIPVIQQKLEDMIDAGVEKAGELKEFISGVFNSDDYHNADGFAEKFFVAWGKIIAEPFEEWWASGGEEMLLGKLADFGEGAGELLNGIITGIFAAIQGKDIDFEGLNMTGIGKAGAEAAKTFVSSFVGGLNIGDLFGKLPGLVKFGALGFGAFKVGNGLVGAINTFGALKDAIFGVESAASITTPAVTAIGKSVISSAAGVGKGITLLGGLKTVLTAIPGWGWVAAAAITAAVIGVKAYNDAQEEQRWALKRSSEATAESIEEYKEAARAYTEFSDTADRIKTLQLKIESSNTNPQTAEYVQELIDDIEDKTAQINVIMSESSLTPEQISAYTDELTGISTRKAEILLVLEEQSLNREDIEALCGELDQINSRRAEITAEMSEAGLNEEDIGEIVGLLDKIGNRQARLDISMGEGALGTKELQELNNELQSMYQHLIDTSGGVVTQADVDAGRITPEYLDAYEEKMRIRQETELYEAQAQANASAELVPQGVAERAQARQEYEAYMASSDNQFDEKSFLENLEDARASLVAQYEAGAIDKDTLFQAGLDLREKWASYYGDYSSTRGNMTGLTPDILFGSYEGPFWNRQWQPGDNDFFRAAIEEVNRTQEYTEKQAANYNKDYESQNAALVQNYQNQKGLIEGWTFQGTDFAGMSLEEIASNYATLDDAGRKMFDDAVAALNVLNAQTDYITDDEKTQAVDVVDLAAKADVMSMVQQQLQTMDADYHNMTAEQQASFAASEEGVAQLTAINDALSGLGIENIGSLDQLNSALESLSAIDLSTFSLAAVQTAFVSLGGDAATAQAKVDALRNALNAIDGTNTSSTHTHTNVTTNKTINVADGRVSVNALGGIYDGAMLSWVAEDGPEAIIPLGAKRRERGLQLWLQAGEMLGVAEFADGGIAAPYAGALDHVPDDNIADKYDVPARSGQTIIYLNVSADATYEINGGDSNVIEQLSGHEQDFVERIAAELVDQIEDIRTNPA